MAVDRTGLAQRLAKHNSTGKKYARKSRAYSQYFEGYTEYLRCGEKGRKKIVREYTADWYVSDEPVLRHRVRKLCYLLAASAAFSLFAFLSVQPYEYNYTYGISIIQVVGTLMGAWSILSVLRFACSKAKMTIYEYKKATSWVRQSSLAACICYCLMAGAVIVSAATAGDMSWLRAAVTTGGYTVASLLALSIYVSEKNAKYATVPNETYAAPDGYTIEN